MAVTNGKFKFFSSVTVTSHEEKQSVICLKPLVSTERELSDIAMMGASLLQRRKCLQVNLLLSSSLSPKDPPKPYPFSELLPFSVSVPFSLHLFSSDLPGKRCY